MKQSDFHSARNNNRLILSWAKRTRGINLLGGKCSQCGNDNIFVLDFHHFSEDKEFKINKIKEGRWS